MEKKSILIVEDDEEIREPLKVLFTHEGYIVHTAVNGHMALQVLERIPTPSLILLDLMMPVMNGWEFLRAQKADPRLSSIPVIVVTAASDQDARQAPASLVLKKPFELRSLIRAVQAHAG